MSDLDRTQPTALHIDLDQRHQTIRNFGASDAWSMDPIGKYWPEEKKEHIADLLFSPEKGIGLSAWRFEIGAGSAETDTEIISNPWRKAESFKASNDAKYDWSKQSGQQWFLQAAKERGVNTFIAFANSPPVWMTKNGHGQADETVGSTNLKPGYENEFATFLMDVLEHFKNEGIVFDYISPINEPTWDWNKANQEGNRYNNDDLVRVIRALHAALQQRDVPAKILTPEAVEYKAILDDAYYQEFAGEPYMAGNNKLGFGAYKEYIQLLLGDPEIKKMVGGLIASHAYFADDPEGLVRLRELVRQNVAQYNGELWQTEYCILGPHGPGRDLSMDAGLHVARVIHHDLAVANVSAWQWWTAVSKEDYKDGLIYTDFEHPGDPQNMMESKILWALGHYSKFIRPNAQRVQLSGIELDDPHRVLASAYVDTSTNRLIVVCVNSEKHDHHFALRISGMMGREVTQFTPYVTSETESMSEKDAVSSSATVTIPQRSIVTFVGEWSE